MIISHLSWSRDGIDFAVAPASVTEGEKKVVVEPQQKFNTLMDL